MSSINSNEVNENRQENLKSDQGRIDLIDQENMVQGEPSKKASFDLENFNQGRCNIDWFFQIEICYYFLFIKDTPDTDLFDYSPELVEKTRFRADFKILCKPCKTHIDLYEINEHKQFHEALTCLGLKYLPENEEILKEKRVHLLKTAQMKYLKKKKDFNTSKALDWNNKVKQINSAFELLKSYADNTFEVERRMSSLELKLDAYGYLFNSM